MWSSRSRPLRSKKNSTRSLHEGAAPSQENNDMRTDMASMGQGVAAVMGANDDVIHRIGNLIRMLRDSMRALGLDKEVEKAAQAIPDARDRLTYIASMTEQAAERSLNAIDRAQPIQNDISARATMLAQRYQTERDDPQLMADVESFLNDLPKMVDSTNRELLEIMMAQDFQDLTGQVIKKMMDVIRGVEFQLLQVVLDNVPQEAAREDYQRRIDELKQMEDSRRESFLHGPQVRSGEADVMDSQSQVDDLLAELGF
jgi:Chemotaxis protein